VLYFLQDWMLFPANLAPAPAAQRYSATTEELRLDIDGGGQVVAWFIPALSPPTIPVPLVVYFHGNAEIIDYQWPVIEGYQRMGCSILLPEYRGYGRAAGEPSEHAIVADSVRFLDLVLQRSDVDRRRVILHGRSLGGGVAAGVATQRPPQAMILESTFASVAAMASRYLVPSCLVKNKFHVDRVVETLDVPLLLFHGTNDDIIPVKHGRKLRELARRGTYVEYDCRHNDFPGAGNEEAYWGEIAGFLRREGIVVDDD
jgi:fermentation-respiration switch protein FrsA (DUF1100 family)